MKTKLLAVIALPAMALVAHAATPEPVEQNITIGDKTYTATLLEKRDIGPGTTWRRIRINAYPLNINLVTMDITNPYARVETFQGQDKIGSTESIVTAANRLSADGHKAVAAANGNFWCVSGQEPWSDLLIGTTFGGNMRNGKIITETNNAADQWCGTPLQTCVIGAAADRLWIEPLVWRGYIAHEKTGYLDYQQVNKVVRDNEIGLYNSWYPAGKKFQPVTQAPDSNGKQRFTLAYGDATEVYLNLDEGQQWTTGQEFVATVTQVRTNAGDGTLGNADLCLVARGAANTSVATLEPGDKVRLYSGWTSFATWETPALENVMQGLALILNDGETDPATNQNNSYNNQVYPKTVYGCDKDNTTLYMMTIDKSTDPVWGSSAGCPSWVACDILKHYGCWRAAAVDAGGSTEMFVTDRIVNRTTESTPRPVANGWMIFDNAPADNTIARLEFDDVALTAPVYSTPVPRILGYNKYGTLVDQDVQGITYSCTPEAGTCTGGVFTAAPTAGTGTLTASLGNVAVTAPITIVNADIRLRLPEIVIDHVRKYPIEVNAYVGDNPFAYHPSTLTWTVSAPEVADIDAQGTLTGLSSGTAVISGSIGTFTDAATVNVEIPAAPEINILAAGDEWKNTVTSAKVNTVNIADNGAINLDFNITSTRGTKVTLNRDHRVYGLPDAMTLAINPGTAEIKEVILGIQTPLMTRAATATFPVSFEQGQENTVRLPLDAFGDTRDLGFYPVTFKSIGFTFSSKSGNYSLQIPSLSSSYDNYVDGVQNVSTDSRDNTCPPSYYTFQGIYVGNNASALTPGIYLERRGTTTRKLLIH